MTTHAPALPAVRPPVLTRAPEVRSAVALVWGAAAGVYLVQGDEWVWPVGLWATVTTIMTWPVLRGTGRPYLSYRRPLFLVGVAGMAGLPLLVWALFTDWSSEVKLALLLAVLFELGVTGFLAALPPAVARPVPMFFKPDLIFGDGRTLVPGIIALLIGTRLLVFEPRPEGFPLPVPAGSWWGLLFAIGLGIIPIIPIRAMAKILLRFQPCPEAGWEGQSPAVCASSCSSSGRSTSCTASTPSSRAPTRSPKAPSSGTWAASAPCWPRQR